MAVQVVKPIGTGMVVVHREVARRWLGGDAGAAQSASGVKEVDTGLYGEQVLPRIINVAYAMGPIVGELRQRVCAGLSGEVVEIGFRLRP